MFAFQSAFAWPHTLGTCFERCCHPMCRDTSFLGTTFCGQIHISGPRETVLFKLYWHQFGTLTTSTLYHTVFGVPPVWYSLWSAHSFLMPCDPALDPFNRWDLQMKQPTACYRVEQSGAETERMSAHQTHNSLKSLRLYSFRSVHK